MIKHKVIYDKQTFIIKEFFEYNNDILIKYQKYNKKGNLTYIQNGDNKAKIYYRKNKVYKIIREDGTTIIFKYTNDKTYYKMTKDSMWLYKDYIEAQFVVELYFF